MTTENQSPENTPGVEKKKLTDNQLRAAQIVAGLLCAAAMIVSIFVSQLREAQDNVLLQYLFLIVFLVVMFGRRQVEKKFRLRLSLFSLAMIDGIVVGIMVYTGLAFFNPSQGAEIQLDETYKILIMVAIGVVLIGLGIIFPLVRYMKRRAAGITYPIRIPEPEEQEEESHDSDDENTDKLAHLSPIERQIAEMSQELDENGNSGDTPSDDGGDDSGDTL